MVRFYAFTAISSIYKHTHKYTYIVYATESLFGAIVSFRLRSAHPDIAIEDIFAGMSGVRINKSQEAFSLDTTAQIPWHMLPCVFAWCAAQSAEQGMPRKGGCSGQASNAHRGTQPPAFSVTALQRTLRLGVLQPLRASPAAPNQPTGIHSDHARNTSAANFSFLQQAMPAGESYVPQI